MRGQLTRNPPPKKGRWEVSLYQPSGFPPGTGQRTRTPTAAGGKVVVQLEIPACTRGAGRTGVG